MSKMDPDNKNIAKDTVQGSMYSVFSSGITIALGLGRSILMARLLLPEHYGVAAMALFFINSSSQIYSIGMDSAIIQRKTAGEKDYNIYFTLRIGLTAAALALLSILTPFIVQYYPGYAQLQSVIYAYIGISLLKTLNGSQLAILTKDLAFKQIAIADTASAIFMTIFGPLTAWLGWGVWSIVIENLSGHVIRFILIWFFFTKWYPKFAWDKQIAGELVNFGVKLWVSSNLNFILDRFDDFWTGTFLGQNLLGFYNKAYEFANYPGRILGNAIVPVFYPAFARLQDDKIRLSRAFFRLNILIVRVGFWFSMILVLTAPEAVPLIIGSQWEPMVPVFQWMILYTLMDPLVMVTQRLIVAIGQPDILIRVKLLQVVVFIPMVIFLANRNGIIGVAIAADLMLFIGVVLMYYYCNRFVDYSNRILWLWPVVSICITIGVLSLVNPLILQINPWINLSTKIILITGVYWGVLFFTERNQLVTGFNMIWGLLAPQIRSLKQSN